MTITMVAPRRLKSVLLGIGLGACSNWLAVLQSALRRLIIRFHLRMAAEGVSAMFKFLAGLRIVERAVSKYRALLMEYIFAVLLLIFILSQL